MRKLLDVFWPDHCTLCGMRLRTRPQHLLCNYCWEALPWLTTQCRHCAHPLSKAGVCGQCLQQPLIRGRALAALQHAAEAQYLVGQLKFHHGFREAQTLAMCLAATLQFNYNTTALPSAIIPTPMSWWGLVRRGYNQSALLAQHLSRLLSIPICHPLGRKHGPAQRSLTREQRLALDPTAFPPRQATFLHTHVAIIDDVLTTGSTVRAMAASLAQLGVRRADVWCATRAIATVGDEHTLRPA